MLHRGNFQTDFKQKKVVNAQDNINIRINWVLRP